MLVDSSVLIRSLQPNHSLYNAAERAIRLLPELGRKLRIVAQNLIELWVVATRPLGENGLGAGEDQGHASFLAGDARDLSGLGGPGRAGLWMVGRASCCRSC
jgi:hypothetical protein